MVSKIQSHLGTSAYSKVLAKNSAIVLFGSLIHCSIFSKVDMLTILQMDSKLLNWRMDWEFQHPLGCFNAANIPGILRFHLPG